MKKFQKKRGITIIEIIISVAVLGIVIVPIGSAVITSTKINKDAEISQKATYITQKTLENTKFLKSDRINDLFTKMKDNLSLVEKAGTTEESTIKEGTFYFDNNGNSSTLDDSYYLAKVKLSSVDHSIGKSGELKINNGIDIKDQANLDGYIDGSSTFYNINSENITIKMDYNSSGSGYVLTVDGTGYTKNIGSSTTEDLNFTVNVNKSFPVDSGSIKISIENITNQTLNVYLYNDVKADCTINSKYGMVNQFSNYTTNSTYSGVSNSVKVEIETYIYDQSDSNTDKGHRQIKKIANVDGYINLGE